MESSMKKQKKARTAGFVSMYANASIAALPCYLRGEEPWTPTLSAQCLQCVNRPTYLELQPLFGAVRETTLHMPRRTAFAGVAKFIGTPQQNAV
jgi:hypothetical protein